MTNHEGNMKIYLDRGIQEGLETMSVKLGGYSIFDIGCSIFEKFQSPTPSEQA